ncbi:MAG: hypothetical protein JW836_00280, partial [Deltaproteobacteria bacterium]|nr:hypothetical protein [Deltaproteobacteria bacterium]
SSGFSLPLIPLLIFYCPKSGKKTLLPIGMNVNLLNVLGYFRSGLAKARSLNALTLTIENKSRSQEICDAETEDLFNSFRSPI